MSGHTDYPASLRSNGAMLEEAARIVLMSAQEMERMQANEQSQVEGFREALKAGAELRAENERLRAALESCASWIDRWSNHVGTCEGGDKCTCGRTAILYEARNAEQEVRK